MEHLISIVIPVFNGEAFLSKAVDSCIRQSYPHIEVVCVDDGSTDGSASLLDQYAERDKRVRVIHKENGGVVSARKEGIRQSRGELITFVDADDFLHEHALRTLVAKQEDTGCDIVVGQSHWTSEGLQVLNEKGTMISGLDYLRNMLVMGEAAIWGKLYRKSLFNAIDVSNQIKWAEDYAMLVQLMAQAQQVAVLQSRLYCYVDNPRSVTKTASVASFMTWRDAQHCIEAYLAESGIAGQVSRELCCCRLRWELTSLRTALCIKNYRTNLRDMAWRYLVFNPCCGFFCLRHLKGSLRFCMIVALLSPRLAARCLQAYGRYRMRMLKGNTIYGMLTFMSSPTMHGVHGVCGHVLNRMHHGPR